jgi:RNA polymerase sigma-70 factor (ECF subfamily)
MAPDLQVDAQPQAQDDRDTRSDLELVAAINGGDADAFEVLYLRYRDWVTGLAYRFTGDNDAALDVLQETFLYFLKKFPGFRLTANLKTFLYPAVRNLSIAARRKAARFQSTEPELAQIEQTPSPEVSSAPKSELEVALSSLPEEQREVLLLRFVDNLKLLEIAEAAEVPLGTVKSRLHNALKALRDDPRTRLFFER